MTNKKLENVVIEEKVVSVSISFNAHENKALKGFANVSILDAEGKLAQAYFGLSVIQAKDGSLFVVEPVRDYGKKEDGTPDYEVKYNHFIMDRKLKDIVSTELASLVK